MKQAGTGTKAKSTMRPLRDAFMIVAFLAIAATVNISENPAGPEVGAAMAEDDAVNEMIMPASRADESLAGREETLVIALPEELSREEVARTLYRVLQRIEAEAACLRQPCKPEEPARRVS